MQLYQLLREVRSETPICLFDISGVCIGQFITKEDIPTNLYEYDILDIGLGTLYIHSNKSSCLYINIQK